MTFICEPNTISIWNGIETYRSLTAVILTGKRNHWVRKRERFPRPDLDPGRPFPSRLESKKEYPENRRCPHPLPMIPRFPAWKMYLIFIDPGE
jgi:hypothetical protein